MNEEIFNSFLTNGLVLSNSTINPNEVKLLFPSKSEANLMYTVQIDVPFITNMKKTSVQQYQINQSLKGYFLYANEHDFLDTNDIKLAKQIFPSSFQFIEYNNKHFWPFFNPDEFANKITELILHD